jgi:hypothetical protein
MRDRLFDRLVWVDFDARYSLMLLVAVVVGVVLA